MAINNGHATTMVMASTKSIPTNTAERCGTSVPNFLHPFRGVHKRLLSEYVAICEFNLNLKCVTNDFIATLVIGCSVPISSLVHYRA